LAGLDTWFDRINYDKKSFSVPKVMLLTPYVIFLDQKSAEPTKPTLVEAKPVTNQIVELHFNEGYVIHHKVGHPRSDERVVCAPLDVKVAGQVSTYQVTSDTDAAYRNPLNPTSINRKSKGTDFAWHFDRWVNNHVENNGLDHTKEHWVYLGLPKPMKDGSKYTVSLGSLSSLPKTEVTFDSSTSQSETVHVNLVGYSTHAPKKYGYVYQWLGDGDGLDLSRWEGKRFWLIDQKTGRKVFGGKVGFRGDRNTPETSNMGDTPGGNYICADVYQCDFSGFNRPGKYRLAVQDIGCSFPFAIASDVYRQAFHTVASGIYHQRSGIALTKPYTNFERPAPHNPLVTPGFEHHLKYTTSRFIDWKNWDNSQADRAAIQAGIKGDLDISGWYQDAGDWDSYYTHLQVATDLLISYQLAPHKFRTRELNIPESSNGLPDILNEAAWLPRFCYRERHALLKKGWGTGGLGLRVCGDHFGGDTYPGDTGQGSWQDVHRIYTVSGEDPLSTYSYAASAAQLARCLTLAGKQDPQGIDWKKEAIESYVWAKNNTRPGDDRKDDFVVHRLHAAAALFVLTGQREYEADYARDFGGHFHGYLGFATLNGPAVYALGGGPTPADPKILEQTKTAIFASADEAVGTANRRPLRWGGNWGFPMLVGQLTTPWVEPVMIAYGLTKTSDPVKAQTYLATLYTTADYFLGTNPLNQTWVSGLGPRYPHHLFKMDSWYLDTPGLNPGIVPYGPWRKEADFGSNPTNHDWPNKTVYPVIDKWPGGERWFSNQCCPMTSEFTVWQNIGPTAALFGFLCSEK
jgi:endoglucanase